MIDDEKFWLQVQTWIQECEEFEREQAAAMNSPETIELIRRTLAECEEAERCRIEYENSPEGIEETQRLFAYFLAQIERCELESIKVSE